LANRLTRVALPLGILSVAGWCLRWTAPMASTAAAVFACGMIMYFALSRTLRRPLFTVLALPFAVAGWMLMFLIVDFFSGPRSGMHDGPEDVFVVLCAFGVFILSCILPSLKIQALLAKREPGET
jgi:hypothetical protein